MKLKSITLGVIAAATTVMAAPASAEQITLKVAHFWPATAMSQQKVLEPWCAKIAAESNDRLKCQIYPAMQIGGTPQQLMQYAADGVADIIWTVPGYTAGRYPSVEVFELPFMSRNAESTSRALWEYAAKYSQKDFAMVKPLAFHVHDNGYIHGIKRPINSLEDFKGQKMRAPTRLTNKLMAAFGASPVAMPMTQVTEAISKGVIDGYVLPWESIPPVKLHELTKYHTETDPSQPALYTVVFTIAMNKARYNSLPDDLKQVIDNNSGIELSALAGRAWDENAAAARELAVQQGNVFNTVSAEEMAKWTPITDKIAADWVKEMSGKGYPAQQMLDDAKALIEKHSN